jgi:mycothiol synthase
VRPPEPFTARPATEADAAAVAELVNAFDRAFLEDPDTADAAEIRSWWLERDAVVVHDPAGTLAAMGMLKNEGDEVLDADLYVSLDFTGRGLGSALLDWLEDEGVTRGRSTLHTVALGRDTAGRRLVEGRGYEPVRHFYRMLVDLQKPPPEPEWPDGFTLAVFRPGDEETLRDVLQDAFADHWGHEDHDLDWWHEHIFGVERWDPSLVYLVRDAGGHAVAAEINAHRYGMGWIGSVGTKAPWRGRGLGRALLLTAFGELYRRGERRIGLGVDAGNETGATHLYESVGMRVAWQADVYEKRV